jgi:hypothetical protein
MSNAAVIGRSRRHLGYKKQLAMRSPKFGTDPRSVSEFVSGLGSFSGNESSQNTNPMIRCGLVFCKLVPGGESFFC